MSDVELGVGDFYAEGGEGVEVGGLGGKRSSASYDEVGLETDTVNFDAAGLQRGDEGLDCCGFGAGRFDIVVVVVEFCIWVGERCGCKGDRNVFFSDLSLLANTETK